MGNEHGWGEAGTTGQESTGSGWQEMEEEFGFKKITEENWLKPDSTMRVFGRLSLDDYTPYVPDGTERVRDAMKIELTDNVPFEVRRLFTVARGALCYGYFFDPLYALASEQLLRVAETTVAHKYSALGGPRRIKTAKGNERKANFEDRLKYLQSQGLIAEDDAIWWEAIRKMRNEASHPHSIFHSS